MLNDNERTFFNRVAAHMADNDLSPADPDHIEKACRAVIERDEQLWLTAMAKNKEGAAIRDALCTAVYSSCRK